MLTIELGNNKFVYLMRSRLATSMRGFSFHIGLTRNPEHRFHNRTYGYGPAYNGYSLYVLAATLAYSQVHAIF